MSDRDRSSGKLDIVRKKTYILKSHRKQQNTCVYGKYRVISVGDFILTHISISKSDKSGKIVIISRESYVTKIYANYQEVEKHFSHYRKTGKHIQNSFLFLHSGKHKLSFLTCSYAVISHVYY